MVGLAAPSASALTVEGTAPAITSPSSTTFVVGQQATFTVLATGSPAPSISLTGGLPAGVSFTAPSASGAAKLSGLPLAGTGGVYDLTLTATNGVGPGVTQRFTLTVDQAPTITSATTLTCAVGASTTLEVTVTATAYPRPVHLSEQGALPSGVTFTTAGSSTAVITCTSSTTAGGLYPFTITAANTIAPAGTQAFALSLSQAPAITSPASATFTAGVTGSFSVTATGYPSSTFSVVTGHLPAGLTLTTENDSTATISGKAATPGTYTFVLEATDTVRPPYDQPFTLTVEGTAPAITSPSSTTFAVGQQATYTVTATGSPAPSITESGRLPAGVRFTAPSASGTAKLTGSPLAGAGGVYDLTLTATNGVGPGVTQHFILTVDQAPTITSAMTASFEEGSTGSFTISAQGFPAVTITEAGQLPSGLVFTTDGDGTATISGSPPLSSIGTYQVALTASNGIAPPATVNLVIVVGTQPFIVAPAYAHFDTGREGMRFVKAFGYPAATLSASGTLPAGLVFTTDGDGFATISGTPPTGTAGSYAVTVTASNGVASVSQTLTVVVRRHPPNPPGGAGGTSKGGRGDGHHLPRRLVRGAG